jgi:hypothetical protein
MAIPDDDNRYLALPYRQSAQLSRDLDGSFNKIINTGALIDGFIGNAAGMDIFETVFFTRQVAGAGESGGSPPTGFKLGGVVTGPISSGNSIPVTGVQASTVVFKKGDSIEIDEDDGVFMVNPITRETLPQRAQFVVSEDIISDGAGNATILVDPEIITTGAYQNISAAIPNGAQIFLAEDHNVSMFFHNQAIVFAAPPITELKGGVEVYTAYSDLYKLSMTYTAGGDIINYKQRDRVDILAGRQINPEFAIRIRS